MSSDANGSAGRGSQGMVVGDACNLKLKPLEAPDQKELRVKQ